MSWNMTRRQLLQSGAALAAGTACPASASESAPIDLVRIRLTRSPLPFDPAESFSFRDEFIFRAIYATLTRQVGDGWSPYLADEVVEDHVEDRDNPKWRIRIKLPDWSNWSGQIPQSLTAADVANTALRLHQQGVEAWQDLKDVELEDRRTVRLILRRKNVTLWRETFPRAVGCITRNGERIEYDNTSSGEASGPYLVEVDRRDDYLVLRCRDEWAGYSTSIKRAMFVIVPDFEAALAMFRAGQLDIVSIDAEQLGSRSQRYFKDFEDSFLEIRDGGHVYYVGMDQNDDDIGDENARKAIIAAIDGKEVIRAAYGSDGAVQANGFVPRQLPGAMRVEKAERNIDQAIEYLKKAGKQNGFVIPIWSPEWLGESGKKMAVAIANQLRKIGITAEVKVVPRGAKWYGDFAERRGLFIERTSNSSDPATAMRDFRKESRDNITNYFDEKYDRLYEMGLNTAGEARDQIYQEMQQLLLDRAVALPLAQPLKGWLYRNTLVQPSFAPNGELGDLLDFKRAG